VASGLAPVNPNIGEIIHGAEVNKQPLIHTERRNTKSPSVPTGPEKTRRPHPACGTFGREGDFD
jgi:hypothetical protein